MICALAVPCPSMIDEAAALLDGYGDEARVVARSTALTIMLHDA